MNPKYSKTLIDAIKADLIIGELPQYKIAKKHGVSQGYVSKVKCGQAKSIGEDVQADPTNKKILELEAQNIALQDEMNRCKKAYKAAQRQNSIFEAMVDEMDAYIKPLTPLPKAIRQGKTDKVIRESLVMHLSDEHADEAVLPHQVGGLERYNFGIALRRAEEYVDSTIKFTQQTLSNYNFDKLYILANGDHTSGEIHDSTSHSEHRNAFRNSLAIGQMHALMFRDLATIFPEVFVVYTPGNHGRRSQQKDHHGAWNNWDYLIAETAHLHCRDIKNIQFLIPDSFSINVEIEGFGFCVTHGDDIKSWNAIPWYGIERKTRRWAALNAAFNRNVQYYCFAHFHEPGSQSALNGETIINGTWIATTPYLYNKYSAYTEPAQWIHGVHHEWGVSWRLKVKLRTPREHLGPNRYSILLAQP